MLMVVQETLARMIVTLLVFREVVLINVQLDSITLKVLKFVNNVFKGVIIVWDQINLIVDSAHKINLWIHLKVV